MLPHHVLCLREVISGVPEYNHVCSHIQGLCLMSVFGFQEMLSSQIVSLHLGGMLLPCSMLTLMWINLLILGWCPSIQLLFLLHLHLFQCICLRFMVDCLPMGKSVSISASLVLKVPEGTSFRFKFSWAGSHHSLMHMLQGLYKVGKHGTCGGSWYRPWP